MFIKTVMCILSKRANMHFYTNIIGKDYRAGERKKNGNTHQMNEYNKIQCRLMYPSTAWTNIVVIT